MRTHKSRQPEHGKGSQERRQGRSWSCTEWPAADRAALEAAFRPAGPFDETGAASRWAATTRAAYIWAYGCWLAHLRDTDSDRLTLPPDERPTSQHVQRFATTLTARVKPITTQTILKAAGTLLATMVPGEQATFFHEVARRLGTTHSPKPVLGRLRSAAELARLGFSLIEQARQLLENDRLKAARHFRDGLMLALLAAVPLRRRNFTGLAIGRSLLREGTRWSIIIPAAEAKGLRSLDYPVPEWLTGTLEEYLTTWRPIFSGATGHDSLWVSTKGSGLAPTSLYANICARTAQAFGRSVNPHLFRTAAVSGIALDSPAQIRLAAGLLGHARLETTEAHYRATQAIQAGRTLQAAVRKMVAGTGIR